MKYLFFRTVIISTVCCAFVISMPVSYNAATSTVTPDQDLQEAVNALAAGDTLLLSEGTYTRKSALYFDGLSGDESNPIVVGAATEGQVTIQLDSTFTKFVIYDWDHNVIHIRNCHYLEIYGIEITAGRTGIETEFINSHCTFRDLNIHHVGNVGIRIANGANSYMKCIGNHLHHTYQHGAGLYIGDNDGSADFNNCLFEGNYIHHTSLLENQGDGIELKKMCWGNTISHNVIHNTHYPGILVWGTGKENPRYNNKVYGNLVFKSGGEHGMQIASECDVYNNIVFDGGSRRMYSALQSNQNTTSGTPMNNIRIFNNTFFGTRRGVLLLDWEGKDGMVFSNNAVYCLNEEDEALSTNDGNLQNAVIQGNYCFGSVAGPGLQELIGTGIYNSLHPDKVFVKPENDIASIDLYPLDDSDLVNAAGGTWVPEDDFNMNSRPEGDFADVGAYEFYTSYNPGWRLAEEPKPLHDTPDIPSNVPSSDQSSPEAFSLGQNAPNPFNPSTMIEYRVAEGYNDSISLTVHDVSGQLVRTLVKGKSSPGTHTLIWNGNNDSGTKAASGMYFLRLDSQDGSHARKMVLLK